MLQIHLRRTLTSAAIRQMMLVIPAWLLAIGCALWAGLTAWSSLTARTPALPVAAIHDRDPLAVAARLASPALFANQSARSATPALAVVPDLPSTQLHGVATGFHGGSAFALLSAGGNTTAYREGEQIGEGWRLRRILADRVELEADGRRAILRLSDPTSTPAPGPSGTAARSEAPEPQSNDD
jgi:hypothetical protein